MKPVDCIALTLGLVSLFLCLLGSGAGRHVIELGLDLINGFKAARRQRALIREARRRLELKISTRPSVMYVGTITYGPEGFVLQSDWIFRPDRPWQHDGFACSTDIDGQWRAFGYTQRELEEIHARRSEFNV